MKIFHTSDWHLGHTLHGLSRELEHNAFLAWLLDQLEGEDADALLIAGDVFETANPSVAAQRMFFTFLADARRRLPHLNILVIGGNHDSAGRLDAWAVALAALEVRVVGGLLLPGQREVDLDRLLVPIHRPSGDVGAWVAAVPFLRPADLRPNREAEDWLTEGVINIYDGLLDEARNRQRPGQALLAMGHCYMVGATLSELSERKVLCGNQHALPVGDLFPEDLAYAALGHLHRAQAVGGRESVRYSGSPIPLSLAEADYLHQVVVVELEGADLRCAPRVIPVPHAVEMLRLPAEGPLPLAEVLPLLRSLPKASCPEAGPPPYLEVRLKTEGPQPGLRQQIEAALEGHHVRLVKLTVDRPGLRLNLAAVSEQETTLTELSPNDVLNRRWATLYDGQKPSQAVAAAFHELVDRVGQEDAA
jgi:DNA repair protein SbcD/Mre11